MPQSQPNQIARVLAVAALVAAFLLVVVTIATSGDSSDGGESDDSTSAEEDGTSRRGERALDEGVWVVREGDTFVSVSEATGIDADELIDLNPDIDPQAVIPGQRIFLREGVEAGPTDAGDSPGADATGFGDEGPTGTADSTTTDGFGAD